MRVLVLRSFDRRITPRVVRAYRPGSVVILPTKAGEEAIAQGNAARVAAKKRSR